MTPPAGEGSPRIVEVDAAEAGERLDKLLAARDLGFSRAALQRFLEQGRVLVGGVVADRRTRPRAGDRVEVWPAPPPPSDAAPEPIPLDVRFEDAHLLVVDKPAGLVVHPAPGHPGGTLVNAVLHHTRLQDAAGARPGIVHRLDKDTSGVMVVAKTEVAKERLVATFQAHDLDRRYLAIAVGAGLPEALRLDTLHGRHPRDRKRFTTRVERGKRAVTDVAVVERLRGAALVECRLSTGRTHQIRVQLSEAGHPILGDPVYGRAPRDAVLRGVAQELGRQALHAAVLAFAHPVSGEPLRFEAPPPADMAWALVALR